MVGACSTHGEMRNAYKILVRKLDGQSPLWRPRRGWEDNIKMDLKQGVKVWTAFIWLIMATCGGIL